MSYIQLIEKAVLPTSLWLTFWDLSEGSQLSLEIAAPTEIYDVGRVCSAWTVMRISSVWPSGR